MEAFTPTARLILAHLQLKPNQTLDQLKQATGTRDADALYNALRLVRVAGLVMKSTGKPAVYSLRKQEPSDVQ